MTSTRRTLLASAAAAATIGLDGFGFLSTLPSVSAQEAKLDPSLVRIDSGVEPLVKLLEETPREKIIDEVASRVKAGLNYQELLAALLLAGVRNVQPRPSVGFKFHAVLVVNSAHLASLASPDKDRWLPIFWAVDYFKNAQAQTTRESGWRMARVDESRVPDAAKAREAFINAMEKWDETAADAAAAGVARYLGANEAFELYARFGCRDFRDIGHKAIYVSNAFRALQCIGWQHAEPVLRSLAYALMKTDGQNPAERDLAPDRPGRRNKELAAKIRPDWQAGKLDPRATREFITAFRTVKEQETCEAVVMAINDGVSPRSIWDAIMSGAGELMMRKPGIVAVHAVTSTNALHHAYQACADEQNRKLATLQAASFLTLFRENLQGNGQWSGVNIDEFEAQKSEGDAKTTIAEIFADAGRDRAAASRKALGYLQGGQDPQALITAARQMIFAKGTDSHDYKYSSAVLEDYHSLSPSLRDRVLASSLFYLKGSSARDNAVVQRTRAALSA